MQRTNEPFLKHLNVHKTPYVIVTAEDENFDDVTLQELQDEGFETHYVPMLDDTPAKFAERLYGVGNQTAGVNERYAVVAYGDAASALLEHHAPATSRLCALIAYYPTTIPDPSRTSYGMDISILVHLAGNDVGVRRNQEVLGIQGKRKTVRKRIEPGLGVGGELKLAYPSYSYAGHGAGPGFAEHDLDEYDAIACDLARGRTLRVLRETLGVKADLEGVRDRFLEGIEKQPKKALQKMTPDANVILTPTLSVAHGEEELEQFYRNTFSLSPTALNAKLLSRTIGTDRVVDEMNLSFVHDREIPWLLPNIPATHREVEMTLISIVLAKGGKLAQEHVYWDQASILVQVGLLDPSLVSNTAKDLGVSKLPVIGKDSARKVRGEDVRLNSLPG